MEIYYKKLQIFEPNSHGQICYQINCEPDFMHYNLFY